MAFDAKGPNFRHEKYADYKANRPPMPDDLAVQIPYIKKIVEAHNIHTMEELNDLDKQVNDFARANTVSRIVSVSDTCTTDASGATIGIIRVVAYE